MAPLGSRIGVNHGSFRSKRKKFFKSRDTLRLEDTRQEEGRCLWGESGVLLQFFSKPPKIQKMLPENPEIAVELLDNSPDAMMALSPKGTVVYWNTGAENTFGYSRDEAIGLELTELIIPADRLAEEKTFVSEVLAAGHSTIGSVRQRKDGGLIPVDISTRVILDDSGRVKYILSSTKDITDRKLVEEALQGSEIRYRRLFESAKDGILILDADSGQIVDVNPYLVDLLGSSREDLIGKELWQIGSFKDIVASKIAFAELQSRGYIRYENLPLESRDGVIRQVEVVGNIYLEGESRVIQCNIRDITERKQAEAEAKASEARYQTLFEYAPDGILIADAESYYIDANASMCRLLGYSREELIGLPASNIVSETEISHITSALNVLHAKSDHHREWQFRRKDGSLLAAEVIATMMPDGNLMGMVRDITDRKLAEDALQQTNQRLEGALAELQTRTQELESMTQQLWQASKLATMGELAASIAHELNNPLATISLHTEFLIGPLADDDANRQSLLVVQQQVERMASLVSNLLLFSRRSHQQISTVNIIEELQNSLEFINYHLRSHSIVVETEFASDLPNVQADTQQLRQVFLNLLTNASDAMPEGGTLTIRSRRGVLETGPPAVVIEFTDSGKGVQPEDLPRLWEAFFTTKPEGKGTGLGLSICRRTVEEHGGTIDLESLPGKGTTVRILLPAMETGAIQA